MKYSKCILLTLTIVLAFSFAFPLFADEDETDNLFSDLMVVEYINRKLSRKMPVFYDFYQQGGYFNMPSARMGEPGEIGGGYSHVHHYTNYSLRAQLFKRLEVSGSYRIFNGVDDPILTPLGFGDLSDKGANLKLALLIPEESDYRLPGLAVGLQDFMGTKGFIAKYIVLTQVFLRQNLEVSLGYGTNRLKGFFGGVTWLPFRLSDNCYLKDIAFVAEYDNTPYKDPEVERHPRGRVKKSPFNVGLKYRLWDQFDFAVSYIKGHTVAYSISTYYNFGTTKGFIPKINIPPPYTAPVNVEPVGPLRPAFVLSQELAYAFKQQGFDITQIWLSDADEFDCEGKTLWIRLINGFFRSEHDLRDQLNNLLASLVPEDIERTNVIVESDFGFPVNEYRFNMTFVRQFGQGEMGTGELNLLTNMTEVAYPNKCADLEIYKNDRTCINFELLPKTHSFFGSSRGKFKYSLGLNAGVNGFLPGEVYYSVLLGYNAFSNLHHISPIDRLNPSRLINVRTDIVRYYQQDCVTIDEAYLQKVWNMGKGWFSRVSFGHFEEEYGGLAAEFLYCPIGKPFAFGLEGALLGKRTLNGIGFTNKVRKYKFLPNGSFYLTHKKFIGSQYFFDFYYFWEEANVRFKVMTGKFLANDWGARFELARQFESGLTITIWYTLTNAHDVINGSVYHDKGIAFNMPLDIFYTCYDRNFWNYGLSAWLRDVGATSFTGRDLYRMIQDERWKTVKEDDCGYRNAYKCGL
jgi:hypothetical protein